MQIPEGVWEESLEQINTCSINSRHCLIQFQVLHKLHYTKLKLHRLFPDTSPQCDKCNIAEANHVHSFISCPKLEKFGAKIFKAFSDILNTHIEPDPVFIILGTSDSMPVFKKSQQQLLSYGLITAKKLILTFWKKKEVPTFKLWLNEMTNTLHLEKIRFSLNKRESQFDKIWPPLVHYLTNNP